MKNQRVKPVVPVPVCLVPCRLLPSFFNRWQIIQAAVLDALLIYVTAPQNNLVLTPEQAQTQWQRDNNKRQHSLKYQGVLHVLRGASVVASTESVTDNDQDGAEELATRPCNGGRDLWAEWVD